MGEQVIANAILRAKDGSSILEAEEPITSETVAKYKIENGHLQEAFWRLSIYASKCSIQDPPVCLLPVRRACSSKYFIPELDPVVSR